MRRLLVIAFILVLGLGIGGKVWALSYSGDIIGPATLTGTDGWSDAELTWTVDNETDPDGYWTYSYTFTVDEKDISHFIFEVSLDFTSENIKPGTTAGYALNTYSETGPGKSNPGLDPGFYGIKWDAPDGEVLSFSATIVSDKAPMWGDFYAKDGKFDHGQFDVYAYNLELGNPTTAAIDDGNAGGWVLVPDTLSVPEPSTLLLLGSGLLGLALLGRRRSKSKS